MLNNNEEIRITDQNKLEEAVEKGTHCICGRPFDEDYFESVEDNCYSHMTSGY